jgi:hypothetical protein
MSFSLKKIICCGLLAYSIGLISMPSARADEAGSVPSVGDGDAASKVPVGGYESSVRDVGTQPISVETSGAKHGASVQEAPGTIVKDSRINNTLKAVSGQSINLSSITGRIMSADGKLPVSGARLVLTEVGAEHKRYESTSDIDGYYHFHNVDPGNWTLTSSAADMLSSTQKVTLIAGDLKNLDLTMEDLEPVDVLRITGKRSLIHPEKIGSTTNLDHRFIQEYKTGNDLRTLVESTPGVMNDSYGNLITRGEHNAVNYVVDGVVIPEAAGVLQQSQPISPRSIQSAQVDIGGYEAQDGGGPLGAVARIKTLPIVTKPNFTIGQQIGGPLAGTIYYNGSGAFSQNPESKWNRLRFESSGLFAGTSLRIAPPVKNFVNNHGADINVLARLEYLLSARDSLRFTVAINESFLGVPTAPISRQFGVRQYQQDRQDYFTLSYKHKFARFFDELNLHILNGFYSESFRSTNAFDPSPNINADQPIVSLAAQAKRFNYIFSAQGDLSKTAFKTHHLKTGFLSEARPVRTSFKSLYFNADMGASMAARDAALGEAQALAEAGDYDAAFAVNTNPFPYGAVISPFTMQVAGPQMQGNAGNYSGFRYLQSAFLQDRWKPTRGIGKRLTLDAGVRVDVQHSVFGNALALAERLASTPGVEPFSIKPFQTQRITSAQASGRYGAAFVLSKNTVLRGSYSDIFTPTPVDYFLAPIPITNTMFNGVYAGTPRPLQPTRGRLVDVSLETQIGPRFVTRTNLFYKQLRNFGDSGVIGNLPIYSRLTNSAQQAYGVETRMDLKPRKDGYGFNGFLSNTIQVAYLRGTHGVSGGFYDFPENPLPKYPDHDRRYQGTIGLGYRSRQNWWVLGDLQIMSGLQNSIDREVFGPHPGRLPALTLASISGGWQLPQKWHEKYSWLPATYDVRVENAFNQRIPVNLGSPFQGTRYSLPCRVLVGCSWLLGKDSSKLVMKPTDAKSQSRLGSISMVSNQAGVH